MLDATQERIIGVLVEKELSVPESYPLTENALLVACNQKSNRDPQMSLEAFQISGALMSLQQTQWVARTERDGGRTIRYRHRLEEKLGLDDAEKAILAELLLRGPQAPGALKPRVSRMGLTGGRGEIRAALESLRARPNQLVEQLPREPRERDARWGHCLGQGEQTQTVELTPEGPGLTRKETPALTLLQTAPQTTPVRPLSPPATRASQDPALRDLTKKVDDLQREVATLREELRRLASDRSASNDPDL